MGREKLAHETLGHEMLAHGTLRHGVLRQVLAKPYSASGLATRMRLRVASSGAQMASRSNSRASFGSGDFPCSPGCGQSLPHTMRSGAALTKACAIMVASGYDGAPSLLLA